MGLPTARTTYVRRSVLLCAGVEWISGTSLPVDEWFGYGVLVDRCVFSKVFAVYIRT